VDADESSEAEIIVTMGLEVMFSIGVVVVVVIVVVVVMVVVVVVVAELITFNFKELVNVLVALNEEERDGRLVSNWNPMRKYEIKNNN
jgi:hypothetical protein